MTYNIRLDTEADGANRWQFRRDLLIAQIELVHPEILGLQEVLPNQRRDLEDQLPEFVRLGGGRDDGADGGEAAPLFIDRRMFSVESSGLFWLSETPEHPSLGWDAAYRRIATFAHLRRRCDGAGLLVVNTHWDHLGEKARLESGRLLRNWLAEHRLADEGVILMGDFNADVGEASMQALLVPAGDGPPLADSRMMAKGHAVGTTITYNGFDPLPGEGKVIDYILVGEGLVVLRYHSLAEHFDGRLASDHFPVIADVDLTAGLDCGEAGAC